MDAMYDSFAGEFAAHAEDSAYNALYDRPTVLALAGDVRGLDVLDAGCGPGLYAAELVARGARVTAFDESAEMVRLARERLGDAVDVRQAALGAPLAWLAGESQDLVVLALVLHHLDDRVAALRELARVLRPGGALVVSTVHPVDDWLRLGGSYFEVERVEERWHDGAWPVRYWRQPLDAWCAEFAEAGFLIERIAEHRPAPEMAERAPADYARLRERPGFVAYRLVKRPAPRLPAPDESGEWELIRQDDNGNVVPMHRYATHADADAARLVYEGRGHRQLYTVRRRPSVP